MNTSPSPFSYRRRLGRAPSPPTWAWYEQIPLEDDDSETDSVEEDSCSEDDEDYEHRDQQEQEHDQSSVSSGEELESPTTLGGVHIRSDGQETKERDVDGDDGEHDDTAESGAKSDKMEVEGDESHDRKDLKGKQRAVDPVPAAQETPRRRERRKKHRQPMSNFRPILTIQRSQGFVWNQDLFVPPYIKDRYVASTSPPNAKGFCGSSTSLDVYDYEVDVVEIHVKEGEFANIIP